ncbi:MAG: DNA-directed RNA polymerase subunit L [Nitrososphaerota archaeon]|nr:DNA-directed RNA polymerase subunit L [Candidatus Bathyarchaeota archaeon]MDW8048088.1 DNA-directed RNA polymerase subunit L [Nitrososphaerota archaeon]
MQLKILKRTQNELKIEIEGEGHTLCNLLESVLLEDDYVEFAGYDIPHPLVSNPVMLIKTRNGKSPTDAVKEAVDKILERGRMLNENFLKALEEWKK